MESGQKSAFVMAEYSKGKVILKYMGMDGAIQSEETLKGSEPELGITQATDENGEKLVIIQSITDGASGPKIQVLVCTK